MLVNKGGAPVRNNGFGDEASVLIVDDGGYSHTVDLIVEEGSDIDIDDEYSVFEGGAFDSGAKAGEAFACSVQDGLKVGFFGGIGVFGVAEGDTEVLGGVDKLDVFPGAFVHTSGEGLSIRGWRQPGGVKVGDRLAAAAKVFDGLPGVVV